MKRAIVGACVALAFTIAVGAQDKKMATEKMDHMAMEKAYSGCSRAVRRALIPLRIR